eukprot:TRINITY_DN1388_c0_g2_i3.p1 TRINITY_DN1388_c0_g2~~TRINITY_DN1388_c0_g2_i3.p1  ORF type:complete len:454 (-),score=144.88 TRINITY_DN1388_c0_g2_i3:74-1366(-)
MVLGSGTYRIGSSVEFDYCAVSCIRAFRKYGHKTVMVNYNPETVSTDYDESEKLYFEELSYERVMDIIDREKPKGVVISVGGQQPQNLALPLYRTGVPILGTNPEDIDRCENRFKFAQMLDTLKIKQPEWKELSSKSESFTFAKRVGYPVLVRPSYVLSGAAMNVAYNEAELDNYLSLAADVSPDHPVVMTKFKLGAREIELDCVASKGTVVNWCVSEHIEDAGVHSGDATMILPSDTIPKKTRKLIEDIGAKLAKELKISGPMNVQFLVRFPEDIEVIECNLRASRSFPFCSKTYDVDMIETAARVFMGEDVKPHESFKHDPSHVCVKVPQFSFQRLAGADPRLGVEMASTGEVACFGDNKYEAFLKASLAVPNNFKLPNRNRTILFSGDIDKDMISAAKSLTDQQQANRYLHGRSPQVPRQAPTQGLR